jgi:exodeoxyribonuclease VII large subunit
VRQTLRAARQRLVAAIARYGLREWPRTLAERRTRADEARERLTELAVAQVEARRLRVQALIDRLRALSPRLVLERGFCIARAPDGTLVRAAQALAVGDRLSLEFARGEADARIEAVRRGGSHGSEEESAGR